MESSNAVKIAGYVVQGVAVICLGFLVYTGKLSVETFLAALAGAGVALPIRMPGTQPPAGGQPPDLH